MEGVRIIDNVVEVEIGVDVAVHAENDVVCQPVELPLIANPNGCAVVTTVVITDYDDQGSALNVIFLRQPITVGLNNATMAIPDTQVQHVLGHVSTGDGAYLDLDQNQVCTIRNCGLELKPDPSTPQSVWFVLRTTETPTYTSGRLTVKVGVLRG